MSRGGRPLGFHAVHGSHIVLTDDGKKAKRKESFCNGVSFSHRVVPLGEWVFIKILEKATNWNGAVRIGFTNKDPSTLQQEKLPKTACPDLTSRPGYWAKAIPEEASAENTIVFFYVRSDGDMMWGMDGGDGNQEKGKFMGGLDVNLPMWALLDIYGSTVEIELIAGEQTARPVPQTGPPAHVQSRPPPRPHTLPAHLNPERSAGYYANFTKVPFHRTTGQNITLDEDGEVAIRNLDKFRNGYCFLNQPLGLEEKLVVYVESVSTRFEGGLAYGMTNCDPELLQSEDLPDNADDLLDRREYWVVNKAVCPMPRVGDELCFHLTNQGEIRYTKNGRFIGVLVHVDHSVDLWPFFDLYGRTHKLRCLGIVPAPPRPPQVVEAASSTSTRPASSSIPSSRRATETDDEKEVCQICFENIIDCTLYPCGHMTMCAVCAMEIKDHQNALCPMCRHDIVDVIKVYRN